MNKEPNFRVLYLDDAVKFLKNIENKVATHGIIKKTQKTPLKEIEKAERIRLEYFKENSK